MTLPNLNLATLGATVRRSHSGKRLTGETVDGSLMEDVRYDIESPIEACRQKPLGTQAASHAEGSPLGGSNAAVGISQATDTSRGCS